MDTYFCLDLCNLSLDREEEFDAVFKGTHKVFNGFKAKVGWKVEFGK